MEPAAKARAIRLLETGIDHRMASNEARAMVLTAAAVCEEKKGIDTRILELDAQDSGFTDFFVITSGANTRQTVAIADEIELRLKHEFGAYANSVEGRRVGEWVLLDYVDFVVHVFLEERRAFYDIERLRTSAKRTTLDELKALLTAKTKPARRKPAVKKAAKKAASAKKPAARKSPAKKAVKSTGKRAAGKAPAKKAATRAKKSSR